MSASAAEEKIKLAHDLYGMRSAAKLLDGDKYPASLADYKAVIKGLLPENGGNHISAFVAASKKLVDEYGDRATGSVLRLGAAAVELMEGHD